ncbi:DNA primase small subunit PriS [Halococcoides cellulosivorans]|uniref:DNA primase small subunit PriS n=1 Tax=Halococcoides cellulosivorans TaxID=1679096 RepID=A0A2R4WXN8_9EURY|nr:DNA primase small subunit PriS [Halococcoides cellulosivorans]AWB26304.1 DNA primase catalytic subunit PriS [Halococcoides cellulosivorans]
MDERTRAYLRGRFGDHYRRTTIDPPPSAEAREWGYMPFTDGGTRMVRHRTLLDIGRLEEFLARERPRHVYFSAGRYDDPGTRGMDAKGWRGSDVVFDLDADHLPSVDPAETSYADMLAACKDALQRLLDFLDRDLGFEECSVVFSGGRGYHVHVRDESIQPLESEARREIVDYVRGIGLDPEAVIREEAVGGSVGRESPAQKQTLPTDGGWSRRAHEYLLEVVESLEAATEDEAIERLQSYDGIGQTRAEAAYRAIEANGDAIRAGNVDVHPGFTMVAKHVISEALADRMAPIDEPVTTDVNRLIRLPRSLHGGSGLEVVPLDRKEIAAFDPLVDAVPETFRGREITVEVSDETSIELDGDSFTLDPGVRSVPEPVGVSLMARGDAAKAPE